MCGEDDIFFFILFCQVIVSGCSKIKKATKFAMNKRKMCFIQIKMVLSDF